MQDTRFFDETCGLEKGTIFLMRDVSAVVGEEGKLENIDLSIKDNLSVEDDELRMTAANKEDC